MVERFPDSTFEPEVALETLFDKSVDSMVERLDAFEAWAERLVESLVDAAVFIETMAEISIEFLTSKFKKSFLVYSLPSLPMKFMVYAPLGGICAGLRG